MRRVFNRREILLCALLPNFQEHDLEEYKLKKGLFIENPWDRVKKIFSKDDHGNFHPDFHEIIQMAQLGVMVGAFYGGIPSSVEHMKKFMEQNDDKIFLNRREANRALSRQSVLGFCQGAAKEVPRFALFFTLFPLSVNCIQAYRNKYGIIEYSLTGLTVGALFRFGFGPKGMLVGGLVGTTVATIYGLLHWSLLKISGKSEIEMKFVQYAWAEHRAKLNQEASADKKLVPNPLEESGLFEEHVPNPLDNLEKGNNLKI